MNKIKVLQVHTRAVIGGSGTNTLFTIEGLDKDRFEAVLACGRDGRALIEEAAEKKIAVEIIPDLVNRVSPFRDTLAFFELLRLIRRGRFHIVHSHNSKAGILARLAACFCRVPIVVHTLHSCVFCYPNLNRLQRYFYLFLEKLAAFWADRLIVISGPLREEFIKHKVAPQDKFVTIYSGIEIERFKRPVNTGPEKQRLGIKKDELVVGTVARFAPGKGLEIFLQAAAAMMPDNLPVRFLLAGDGPLRQRLQKQAQALGISRRCIFTGLRRDIERITALFDVAVSASFYEGMGRVLLEAQAAGKPVVAAKTGGIPDIVRDGETGILVEPGDARALAGALLRLLKDEKLRRQMGARASRWVDLRFSREKMTTDIVRLYEQLIKEKLKNERE